MNTKPLHIYRFWVSGLISGIGSAVGSIINSSSNRKAVRDTNAANLQMNRENNAARRELAEYAYTKDLEQWNRENEYNTPESQMRRLSEAGLNPNLVYGSGAGQSVSAKSPSYKAPDQTPGHIEAYTGMDFGIDKAVSNYLSGEQAMATIGNIVKQNSVLGAQESFIKAQTAKVLAQIPGEESHSAMQKILQQYQEDNLKESLRGLKLGNDLREQQKGLNELRAEQYQQEFGLNAKRADLLDKQITALSVDIAIKGMAYMHSKIDYRFKDETYDDRKAFVSKTLEQAIADVKKTNKTIEQIEADILDKSQRYFGKEFNVGVEVTKELRNWLYFWRTSD